MIYQWPQEETVLTPRRTERTDRLDSLETLFYDLGHTISSTIPEQKLCKIYVDARAPRTQAIVDARASWGPFPGEATSP